MFNNVKAKKRLTQVLVAFVVICMSVTGSFLLLEDSIDTVQAEERTIEEAADWNNAMSAAANGGTWSITLGKDISVSSRLTAVPANAEVTLNMNNHNITWDTVESGSDAIMDTDYSNGIKDDYFGLITNKGTLKITGTGTIRMKKINYNREDSEKRSDWAVRSCAINNAGTLTVGKNVTVENYTTMARSDKGSGLVDSRRYQTLFVYSIGIYNTGTVTSGGNITSGSLAAGTVGGSLDEKSHLVDFAYGIYGGNVLVESGTIDVEANAGYLAHNSTPKNENDVYSFATGICADNAVVLGVTTINTDTTTWKSKASGDTWKNGNCVAWSTGIMYTKTNYPVIGPAVNINSSFNHIFDENYNTTVTIPGTSFTYTVGNSGDGTSDYARRAYAVAGINKDLHAGLYGGQTSEINMGDTCGNIFGTVTTDAYGTQYSGYEQYVNAYTHGYYSEYAYRTGKSAEKLARLNDIEKQSGRNTGEVKDSQMVNGASGTASTQYMVVYRYYLHNNQSDDNLTRVSYTYDAPDADGKVYLKDRAVIKVGDNENNTGILGISDKVYYSKGGTPYNPAYHSMAGKSYETVSPSTYVGRKINNADQWKNSSELTVTNAPNPGSGNMIIIYMDYVIEDPAFIRVAATSKDEQINKYTDKMEFEVGYTGKALVPGVDFNLAIFDMGADISYDTNVTSDDTDVTSDYDITGGTNIRYDYRVKNTTTWTENALPKDAGEYEIRVNVSEDTDATKEGSYNRNPAQPVLSCKIKPANVVITGPNASNSISGTYGATYNELFNSFNGFTLSADDKALPSSVSGTWSIDGADSKKVPDAGTYTNLKVVWTPNDANKKNYSTAELDVSLVVNKREVNVKVGAGKATYGEATFTSNDFIKFENLPADDSNKTAEWIANTTFTVDGSKNFAAGLPVGSYTLSIESTKFGGAANQNYIFTFTAGSLEIQKRNLYYTAEAAGKTYDGTTDVSVNLTYSSGLFSSGDPYETAYLNVPGTMASANAGENNVTVDTSNLKVNANYKLVISNALTLKATVAKADPKGVAVVAKTAVVTYDKEKTLSSVTLEPTATALAGTWAWESANTVPHVNQNKYVAVFTPADKTNYNTLKQDVTLTVEKKKVDVTVDAITVTYGDNVPVLTVKYYGFTGDDTLATIDYDGNAGASTTYTPGKGVDQKYTISVTTSLVSENYNFVKKDSEITVTPKALTVTANDETITYGDPKPEFSASDVTATGFYGNDSLSSINATVTVSTTYANTADKGAAGKHNINVRVETSNNNYNITCVPGTLTVNKAVVTITPKQKEIKFGQAKYEYAITENDCEFDGFKYGQKISNITFEGTTDIDFNTSYAVGSPVNTYPVSVDTNGAESANYTFVGASGTFKVVKATPKVTVSGASVVNSHSLADAKFNDVVAVNSDSGVAVAGTLSFVEGSFVPRWGTTELRQAVFTPVDDYNYNVATVYVTVNVTLKDISGTPVIQGSAMVDSTLTVSLVSMDPSTADSYTFQWYADGAAISGATGKSYVVAESDKGKNIYVAVSANTSKGFQGSINSAPTDAVVEKLRETTAKQLNVVLPTGVVYDAMSHAGTVAIADGYNADYFGVPVLKYNGSTEAPKAAGTYVVTVDVSAPQKPANDKYTSDYYGPATGIAVGTITIERAPFTVTVKAYDKVYDGTVTAKAKITGSGIANDEVYLADGARFVFANNDTNVGTNKPITVTNVTLLGKDAGNYEIVVNPATASILPRVIYYRASGVDKIYDGLNTVEVAFTYDSGMNATSSDWGYAAVDNASTVYLANGTAVATDVNIGNGIIIENIEATPSGASSNNYEIRISNEATATVNIKKAPVNVVAPVISGIEYDPDATLGSKIDLSVYDAADGSYWVFDDPTIVPTVKQKTYAATYYSKNNNYEDETHGFITVNVTPKKVILAAVDKTITYGSNTPTYTVEPIGMSKETLATIGGNLTVDCKYAPGNDVGRYDIKIKESLTRDNYDFETYDGVLEVVKATINVTASAVDKVYDGNSDVTVKFSELSTDAGVYTNDLRNVALSFKEIIGQAKTANAGSTTVSYLEPVITGEKAKNYQLNVTPKSGVLTVEIAKADLANVVFPEKGKVEYGFDLTYATFEKDGIGDGTFAYENAKLIVPGDTGIYNTYKVIFTPTDPNYNTQEQVVTLDVIKCTLNYQVGVAGTLQEGQTLTAVIAGLPAKAAYFINYQWYRYDGKEFTAIRGANEKSYVATDKDVDYTLVVMTSFDDSAPYVFAEGVVDIIDNLEGIAGESDDTIKEMNLTFWQRLMNWLYRIIAVLTGVQLGGGLGLGG